METFSSYARNFIGNFERPNVDHISGLSPVISIDQKKNSNNPRSTVGTTTEIYDYLRLLYAKVSTPVSLETKRKMIKQDPEKIIEQKGLKQVTDTSEIEMIVEDVLKENQKMVEQFLSGKDKLPGFFVGQSMKKSKGKANPKILNEINIKRLKNNPIQLNKSDIKLILLKNYDEE